MHHQAQKKQISVVID